MMKWRLPLWVLAVCTATIWNGCTVPGNYVQMGRLNVQGTYQQASGAPATNQPLTVLRGYGVKPQKKEMDILRDRVESDPSVRLEQITTGDDGEFHLQFPSFAREEWLWAVPPYSLLEEEYPELTTLLFLKMPQNYGRIYQLKGKSEVSMDVQVYDPNIGRFRQPHRELEEEQVSATLDTEYEPLSEDSSRLQRIDTVTIHIKEQPQQPATSTEPPPES